MIGHEDRPCVPVVATNGVSSVLRKPPCRGSRPHSPSRRLAPGARCSRRHQRGTKQARASEPNSVEPRSQRWRCGLTSETSDRDQPSAQRHLDGPSHGRRPYGGAAPVEPQRVSPNPPGPCRSGVQPAFLRGMLSDLREVRIMTMVVTMSPQQSWKARGSRCGRTTGVSRST
jgi:hypothetical protein